MWLHLKHARDSSVSSEVSLSGSRLSYSWVTKGVRDSVESGLHWLRKSFASSASHTTEYQQKILDAQKVFRQHGVICEQGTWYFHCARSTLLLKAHIFDGQPLCSFPSGEFLSHAGIVTRQWSHIRMTTLEQLKSLFTLLGFSVATREQERKYDQDFYRTATARYRSQLIMNSDAFCKAGVAIVWNRWYLWDVPGANSLLNIIMSEWQRFASFPSRDFLYHHKIVSTEWGWLTNIGEIRELLITLWIPVATQEQEVARWRELIYTAISDLERVGIICEKWVWYFHDMLCTQAKALVVGGRKLQSFPNKKFLTEQGIIPAWQNAIQHARLLRRLFSALGLPVATDKQEAQYEDRVLIPRMRSLLLLHADQFMAYGLQQTKEGHWYWFSRMHLAKVLNIRLGDVALTSFPSSRFLITRGIVSLDTPRISSREQVRMLFQVLKVPLVDSLQERKIFWELYRQIIPTIREKILSHKAGFIGLGATCWHDGVWNLSNIRVKEVLEYRISDTPLKYYPSHDFLREYSFWSYRHYRLVSRQDLIRFFRILGISVLDS